MTFVLICIRIRRDDIFRQSQNSVALGRSQNAPTERITM